MEHGSKYNSQRGSHINSRNIHDPQYEMLKKEFDNKQGELNSLKHAHGKLQKVLTDKGSELSQAVRKAEVNEREVKTLKHKLEEIRKEQQQEKQGKSAFKENKQPLKNLHSNNQNTHDFTDASREINDLKKVRENSKLHCFCLMESMMK